MYALNMPLTDGSPMAAHIVMPLEYIGVGEVCLEHPFRLVGGIGVFVDDAHYRCLLRETDPAVARRRFCAARLNDSRRRWHLGHR
ncbi:hypothetical protein X011_24395 [Mycobacterium tuberculosis variant microti OV254]|nr:hypothetical protein X011_24395 [Mycobacterium tuberculosis variant microti OV254]